MRVGAIDQGTTSTRILVVESSGERRVAHAVEHRQIHPCPGWIEHDPEELVRNVQSCLDAAGPLDALGIDNQGESCLAWDAETKAALSPVIVWQDERTADRIGVLKAGDAEKLTLSQAGLPLDSYFSASKLAWILENVPEARAARARGALRLGTSDAFFMDRLAGRCITDVSTASRTSLMNLASCAWDSELCALFGVPLDCLPEIVPNTGDFGAIRMSSGLVPVTALIVDQQAALYGAGCRASGETKMTFGTGAFALMVTGGKIFHEQDRGLLPTVAWRKHGGETVYALDGGVFTAAAAINWAQGLGLFRDLAELDGFPDVPAIDRGLAFVPALLGLACPHWDRRARGAWLGLGLDDTPKDLMQAVLEGIALRSAEVLHALHGAAPLQGAVAVDGGLAKSGYFLQFLADAAGHTVQCREEPEVTAFGAALLAGEMIGAPPPPDAPVREILSRPGGQARCETFSRAVALVRQWRASAADASSQTEVPAADRVS